QQLADALVVDPGVVAREREILDPARLDRVDQAFGNAAQAEAAGGDQQTIAQQPVECGCGIGIKLLHDTAGSLSRTMPAFPPECGAGPLERTGPRVNHIRSHERGGARPTPADTRRDVRL